MEEAKLENKTEESIIEEELSEERQFVTFYVGEELFGISVFQVKSIIGMTEITYVPNSLLFMKGVINLRGSVVPVIDMRIRFDLEEKDYNTFTVIIIIEVQNRNVGMIVDSVSDVVNIPESAVQKTPHYSSRIENDFIEAIGQVEDDLVIILDSSKLLTKKDFEELAISEEN